MGLPQEILDRILKPGQVVGLWFTEGNQVVRKNLRILDYEPTVLRDRIVGSAATALNTNGTTWDQIQDSSNRYLLQPTLEGYLHQYFYGVNPGYSWLYRSYPANKVRGGLVVPPAIGGNPNIGYTIGYDTPYQSPSAMTESFIVFGTNPAYLGYHPYAVPATITVRMNFWIFKYQVERVTLEPFREYTIGGSPPIEAPKWLTGPTVGR